MSFPDAPPSAVVRGVRSAAMGDNDVREAASLAAALRVTLLPGRRARMGKDVAEWAETSGTTGSDAELLGAYNAAFDESLARARAMLEEWVVEPDGKAAA